VSISRAWFTTESVRFRLRALKARLRGHRAEFYVIKRQLRPCDTVCDIGANKGSFIYWLSCWCWNGRVIAFEPQPDLARHLEKICEAIKLGNVTVEAKAAYSHSGVRNLFVPVGHQPGASLNHKPVGPDVFATIPVPVVSLDEYFDASDKIALLKIDAEGAEYEILKGAKRILRQHAPLLVLECENRHLRPGTVQDVFSYLQDFGYEGHSVCRNRLYPISQFDVTVHQREDGEWFWKSKAYCNNFIFRKPDPD
jgi:FkbM family methyltransferase